MGDGRVMFFDGRTGTRLGPWVKVHDGGVERFAFGRDGALMVSGGRGGTVVLWDVATRQPLGTRFPRPGQEQVRALVFHPSRHSVLVQYSPSGHVTELNIDVTGYLQARACRAAGRNLTPMEWTRYASDVPFESLCAAGVQPPRDFEPRPPAPF